MKAFLLASFVLSICLMIEAVEHLHEGPVNEENQEVVYRVSRGIHGKKKGNIFTLITGNLKKILLSKNIFFSSK